MYLGGTVASSDDMDIDQLVADLDRSFDGSGSGGLSRPLLVLLASSEPVSEDDLTAATDYTDLPSTPGHAMLVDLPDLETDEQGRTFHRRFVNSAVIGFVVAGFLATVVLVHLWNDVFLHGHGFWTTLENVVVGPFVAIFSFVCSVGNVPLAAALWKGGISFGGVVSFVFADLITLPLLLIYRKMYGRRMALRMLGVFWAVMSVAGLATEELFRAAGDIPSTRPTVVAGDSVGINYTTILDVIALVVFATLYWLYRNQERFGGGRLRQ